MNCLLNPTALQRGVLWCVRSCAGPTRREYPMHLTTTMRTLQGIYLEAVNEIGRLFNTRRVDEKMHTKFKSKNMNGIGHLRDLRH